MSTCPIRETRSFSLAVIATAVTLLTAMPVQAEILIGIDDPSTTPETRSELLLMVWDPVKEVSYTKDLGVTAYASFLSIGDPATNMFVAGQQNAGMQRFWETLNTDASFAKFLSISTNKADQYWAIIGGSATESPSEAGGLTMYTTVKHATASGVVNPEYTKLLNWSNENFGADYLIAGHWITLNAGNPAESASFNTHNTLAHGSSFNVKGEGGYVGALFENGSDSGLGTTAPVPFNKVDSSSWFYRATVTGIGSPPVLIDEFDNDANDAYWGLGVDRNGNYILSYTLAAKLTPVATFEGQLNRLRTDFTAQYGGIRFIDVPAGDTLSLGSSISPVPEPATWGLMGLGLAVLAARARRRA